MATIAQTLHEEERLNTLLRQLTLRFGELPLEIIERIRSAPGEQLPTWSDRVLTAQTLEQVFAR